MSQVWHCIPSARPVALVNKHVKLWQSKGYKVALLRDDPRHEAHDANLVMSALPDGYRGYAKSVNALIAFILERDPACEWFVTGGDDTDPDPAHTAEEIAIECCMRFRNGKISPPDLGSALFGVMQPTGDRYAQGSIDRIAGSPWIGREFARRVYKGNGPYWHEYTHFFLDNELKEVAEKYGVYWPRPDLIHLHRHFLRASDALDSGTAPRPVPAHLREANSPRHWARYKQLFDFRRAAGFPGSELAP